MLFFPLLNPVLPLADFCLNDVFLLVVDDLFFNCLLRFFVFVLLGHPVFTTIAFCFLLDTVCVCFTLLLFKGFRRTHHSEKLHLLESE